MLKELVISIQAFSAAHRFIIRHKLWKWILIPGIIYAVLFATGIWLFSTSLGEFLEWLNNKIGVLSWLTKQNIGFLNFLFVITELIFRLILLFFYFSLFKFLFLIVGSPVFAFLSQKTENIIEGNEDSFSIIQFTRDIWRGIQLATRNLVWQTVYIISLLLLTFIPVIGWASPLIAFMVECYYYGFSMMGYSTARHKLTLQQSIQFISTKKGLAIGNGMVFYSMHLIPIVGWVLAPAYAVIAATLSLYHVNEEI